MPEATPFGVQFGEAIDNLKGKLPEVSLKWDDLAGPVHGKVFTVAGATSIDLVRDMHAAVTDAVTNGKTLSQFRKDFDRIVQEHGWTYKGKRGWRSGVIFNTNMRSAHMAGRWKQLIANQANRPYLQYRTAGDARVRPQHRMWNGLIYPLSDSFWETHYPPNGWGCRCTVRAYGDSELKDKDMAVSKPFDMQTREVISRDGEIKDKVPVGIDPGWDHNVGQSWISPELALGQKLARLPRELQGPLVDKTISPAFQQVLNDNFKAFRSAIKQPRGDAQIVGFLDSHVIEAIAEKLPAIDLQSTAAAVFDRKTMHLTGAHKAKVASQQVWPEDWIDSLPENFRNYRAVLWDKINETLVVVPQGSFNATLPKIVLRLNQSTKFGAAASVVSLGTAKPINLLDVSQYELLLGDLKK